MQRRYDEYFAKVILEDLLFDRYGNLQVKDMPDLWSETSSIGIEVTNAQSKKQQTVEACWERAYRGRNEKQVQRNKKQMEDMGIPYQGGIQSFGFIDAKEQVENFLKAFCKKAEKLQTGKYRLFAQYDIFIHLQILLDGGNMDDLLQKLIEANQGAKKYRYVYLLPIENFCEFDLQEKQYRILPYEAYSAGIRARQSMEIWQG